jgi:hypothetical protein
MELSIKTLAKFFPLEQAKRIRALSTGETSPETYSNVSQWLAQCYNRPSDNELIMCALAQELGGFGTEVINGRYVDDYHQDIQAEYVNMGDTYDITILLDHETGRYILTTMGDWVERNEKRRQLA